MKIQNLTPHVVNVQDTEGCFHAIPPSGQVARVATRNVLVQEDVLYTSESVIDAVPIFKQETGEVTGLPPQRDGWYLLVSQQVRVAVPDRKDTVSPGDLVRNEAGQPIGCVGLVANW